MSSNVRNQLDRRVVVSMIAILVVVTSTYAVLMTTFETQRVGRAAARDQLLLESVIAASAGELSEALQVRRPSFVAETLRWLSERISAVTAAWAFDRRGRLISAAAPPGADPPTVPGSGKPPRGLSPIGDDQVAWVAQPVHLRTSLGEGRGPLLGYVVLGASQRQNRADHWAHIAIDIGFGALLIILLWLALRFVLARALLPFYQLIQSAPEAIAVHRGGRLIYVNPALVSYLGFTRERDLEGKPLEEVLSPRPPDETAADLVAKLAGGGPHEVSLLRRDGQTVVAETVAQPIQFEGKPSTLVLARDLSERRRLQAQLIRADRLASVGTLASGVSHEINNPLTFVIANLRYVEEELAELRREIGATDDPFAPGAKRLTEIEEALGHAGEGADRVGRIVRDLQIFSHGDEERRQRVDVNKVLESSLSLVANDVRHRAQLVTDFQPVPSVDVNQARLAQVFLNLLMNASQALPLGDAKQHRIRVATRTDDEGNAVVEIEDSGTGIPAELHERIFDPFFTTKPVNVGTGLGLSICHGIVNSVGGSLRFESEPGKGTTFLVKLPPATATRAAASHPPPSQVSGRRARVLVVDDEPALGTTIKRILQAKHDVRVVHSGRQALELLTGDQSFDVVLCDLMMPDLTGMDLHAALCAERPALAQRFVFMTGGAFTSEARDFLGRVPNRRLEKPFDPSALEDLINDFVRENHPGTGGPDGDR